MLRVASRRACSRGAPARRSTILYHIILYYIILYIIYAAGCRGVRPQGAACPFCVVLYNNIMLCYIILYHIMLYYILYAVGCLKLYIVCIFIQSPARVMGCRQAMRAHKEAESAMHCIISYHIISYY